MVDWYNPFNNPSPSQTILGKPLEQAALWFSWLVSLVEVQCSLPWLFCLCYTDKNSGECLVYPSSQFKTDSEVLILGPGAHVPKQAQGHRRE